jgi:hypothetical protein
MDDIDSKGRVSEPTTHNHNPTTKIDMWRAPSPWPQLPRLRPPPYINAQTCHRSIRCSRCLRSKKMAFQSHPPLASYTAVSILHRLVVTAHPPRWSNRPHLPFQMWACSENPPLLSTSTRRADGGEEKVRNNLLALFSLIFIMQKKYNSCELGYCGWGNSPFVAWFKPSAFPRHAISIGRRRGCGGRMRISSHAIVYIYFLLLAIFHFAAGYLGLVFRPSWMKGMLNSTAKCRDKGCWR